MTQAFICDPIRTPFGRYGGALSSVRTDDLGAIPIGTVSNDIRIPHKENIQADVIEGAFFPLAGRL